MINANELRIGNWVDFCYKHKGEYKRRSCQVISIEEKKVVVLDKGVSLVDEFYPIPLTPEILEACGFRLDSESQYRCAYNGITRLDKVYAESIFSGDDPNLHIDCIMDAEGKEVRRIGVNGFVYLGMYGNAGTPVDLKYLHQLQNCYYFLTNKELIYKV